MTTSPGPVTAAGAAAGPLVLEPSWVLALRDGEPTLLRDHAVVIDGDVIGDIAHGKLPGNDRRISLPGHLLLPGLISSHTHVAGGAHTRGQLESHPFSLTGRRAYLRPSEVVETLDDADLDAVTAYNLAEILRGGCTTQVEQSLSLRQLQSYVRVARRWGVRGYPGGMVPGLLRAQQLWAGADEQTLRDSVPETLAEIAANLEYAQSINGVDNGRILPMMAPHGAETHTPDTLIAIRDAASTLGNGIHTHLATLPHDSAAVKARWGKGPVRWLADFDFFEQRFFGAHLGGWDGADDAAFLAAQRNFTYAHCPSGAGAGSGQALQPFVEALAAGINTTVGLDSHSNDMIENMKLAVLYGRARHDMLAANWPLPMARPTVWDMVNAVTLTPADGLGRADLGRIAVGAKADLVSIDLSGFLVGAGTPPLEPLNNLLYANGLSVRTVITDGNLQIVDGHLVVDDEAEVIRRGGEVNARIWAQLREEGWY